MKLFVAMPYGLEAGRLDRDDAGTAKEIQFDDVWKGIIKPAIPPDWQAMRADELHKTGVIDQLYTEWLLEADIVLADLTFANPNVYYELGIRQALSRKGTVLIAQKGSALPFDVRNQAVLYYDYFYGPGIHEFHQNLKDALVGAAASPAGSPVHTYLPGLFIQRYPAGQTPEREIADLKAEISRLRASASIELGSAAQFERRLTLRGELTDLLSKILRTQLDNAKILKESSQDPQYMQMVSSTLNQENAFLVNEASILIEQIPDMVGAVEYNTIAFSYANIGEDDYAEKYFRRAIHVTDNPLDRGMTQRSFANFLFNRGRLDEARALYQDALQQLPKEDYRARQTNGYTLQGWAWNEANIAGDIDRANHLFAQAMAEYEAVLNPVMRNQLISGLVAMQQGSLSGGRSSRSANPFTG